MASVTSRPAPPIMSGCAEIARPAPRASGGRRWARRPGSRTRAPDPAAWWRAGARRTVDGGVHDQLGVAGHLEDGAADGPLERVLGRQVGLDVPALREAGGEHRRVLARAVLGERRRTRPAVVRGHVPLQRGRRVQRQVRGVLQRVCAQAHGGEDLQHALQVDELAVVARGGQGEEAVRQLQARPEHRHELQRLERRARPDRRGRVARLDHRAARRVEHHEVPQVHRLHHVAADHLGQRRGAVERAARRTGHPGHRGGHALGHHPLWGPRGLLPVPYGCRRGRTLTQ